MNRPSGSSTPALDGGVDEIERALEAANVPILLMVLVHLTGDLRWLEPPFRPSRPRGMDDNPSGELPETVQRTVRRSAAESVHALAAGAPVRLPRPDDALLVHMLSVCMGEVVPTAYAQMMGVELDRAAKPSVSAAPAAATGPRVLIVGAGVSGLCAAVVLQERGIPFEIVEREAEFGGCWAQNRYPGCGVDTPSHLYTFSFAPHRWPGYFARREHVQDYLERVASDFELEGRVRFGTEVTEMRFDGAHDEWEVTTRDGGRETVERFGAVISAVGQLNRPRVPALPGMDSFTGPLFHSAQWPDGLDLSGSKVAVVGTGASAMQIVPAIADEVSELLVFQRSPQWIVPHRLYFEPVPADVQLLLDRLPFYALWNRWRLAWIHNDRVHASLQKDSTWPHPERAVNAANDAHRRLFTAYMEEQLADRPDLLEAALPSYPPFGKRMLIDNGWFAALRRDNVCLVPAGVEAVTANAVIDERGEEHEVDVVVLATGFEAQRMLAPMHIVGSERRTIRELWGDDDARAYLGILVPGFPNLFCLYGPNSNLGHGGSWMTMAEAQAHYMAEVLTAMRERGLRRVEVSREAHDAYNAEVDRRHEQMIWTHPGMENWYRNPRGRVVTNSPWPIVDYWQMTREPDWTHLVSA